MPAVRLTSATEVVKNSSNAFTLATDRPLYTVGMVNTTNKATMMLAADSITVCSQKLTLASLTLTKDKNGFATAASVNTATGNTFPPFMTTSSGATPAGAYYDPAANTAGLTYPNAIDPVSGGDSETITNSIFLIGNAPSVYADATGNIYEKNTDGSFKLDYYGNKIPYTQWQTGFKRVEQSGGAHNVLRYLENWGSSYHQFNGSLICLYSSRFAAKSWRNDSGHVYYNPPNRRYYWDSFLQTAVPPPGMPRFMEVEAQPLERISPMYARNIVGR